MKKNIYYLPIVVLFLLSQSLYAQIHVDENGSVGIGTNIPGTTTKLKLTSSGVADGNSHNDYLFIDYTGSTVSKNHYGINVDLVTNAGYGFGGYFNAGRVGIQTQAMETGSGYRYGLISYAYNGSTQNRAVHAVSNGGSGTTNYGVHSRALGYSNYNCALYGEVYSPEIG